MKTFLLILVVLVAAIIIYFFILGVKSKTGQVAGVVDGQLSQCGSKPNCVCSEQSEKGEHYIEPIKLGDNAENPLSLVKGVIQKMGGVVTQEAENYMSATFTSGIFGFVDDVELRLDTDNKLLHIRSASRVGHSDMGANRKRVIQLAELINNQ